ncbi:hypothetical protein MA16_Dca026839 [Dendrobium catenatum]|uniref:Uncharacterized protein n=1 Tax=Dendrobium catenatum TaxID=906689 RepID=A0A2I0VQ63_9ASPA|nr:hypothetical protein MA16_Dca026839 [Dendrobium catenatum]
MTFSEITCAEANAGSPSRLGTLVYTMLLNSTTVTGMTAHTLLALSGTVSLQTSVTISPLLRIFRTKPDRPLLESLIFLPLFKHFEYLGTASRLLPYGYL